MKFLYTAILILLSVTLFAQDNDSAKSTTLQAIIIRAYEQNSKLKEIPAAVNIIDRQSLERFTPASIVQAVNTSPGVHMEERSPGSYRFNIRGSSLRSPFGVRNVKVYYNDIPFTDPSGHTYLNGLGYYNYNNIEIIKGPGSSLYGAGTGGVMLIESMDANEQKNVAAEYTTGSFGLRSVYGAITSGNNDNKNKISFQHLESEGYRFHSSLERNIFSWDGRYHLSENNLLKTTFLFSHLFYETPGALTRSEYAIDPRASRPGGGGFPGAEQSRASVQQKTFLAGASLTQQLSNTIKNISSLYGMFTELRNPIIRNYGKNDEPHLGGRTVFSFDKQVSKTQIKLIAGGELQQSFSSISVYKNKAGNPDTLQSLDDIPTRQSLLFVQASLEKNGWEITAGGSFNFSKVSVRRIAPFPLPLQNRQINNEFASRISVAKNWKAVTVYSSAAKGFSPPTSAELLPSGSAINLQLQPEQGINYDIGFRGTIKDLSFDINAFIFSLQNTIVQRRDAGGGDFFINAGKTAQRGIESAFNYPVFKNIKGLNQSKLWLSHTWHLFRYKEFKQVTSDYSGNYLPGIPRHAVSTGVDIVTNKAISGNINYYYSDRIPLNDANNEYAASYHLVNARLGFEKIVGNKLGLKLVAGVENLLDQQYSLGNDINGFGGRFFNAAPRRNYYTSIMIRILSK